MNQKIESAAQELKSHLVNNYPHLSGRFTIEKKEDEINVFWFKDANRKTLKQFPSFSHFANVKVNHKLFKGLRTSIFPTD